MKALIVMSAEDNVGNAIEDIVGGDEVSYTVDGEIHTFTARDEIPFGFKAAVRDIPTGGDIIKYKEVVGRAGTDIKAGDCVHIHNVEGTRGRGDIPGGQA
jgi:altronate dehydratase small subunit